MPVIRTIRRDLGLSTGDLLVLGALLSFLPCKDRETGVERPIGPDMMLVVFAGNAALCDRANGMDDRCLRRHLSRLSDAGLVRRRQSATGKRFPLKRDGVIRGAFGIDLTPLLERHEELTERAEQARRRAEELRSLRAEALALRAEALEQVDPDDAETRSFLDQVKTVLRRATLTVDLVRSVIADLARRVHGTGDPAPCPPVPSDPDRLRTAPTLPDAHQAPAPVAAEYTEPHPTTTDRPRGTATGPRTRLQEPRTNTRRTRDLEPTRPLPCPDETSAWTGQNVRHQDTSQIEIKKRSGGSALERLWARCRYVALMFTSPPQDEHGLLHVIHEFGRLARFDDRALAETVRDLGPHRALEVLDHIAGKGASIQCRYAYLNAIRQREARSHPFAATGLTS